MPDSTAGTIPRMRAVPCFAYGTVGALLPALFYQVGK